MPTEAYLLTLALWLTWQIICCRGHAVMTVTPRYQAYPDAQDTGLKVPLRLPVNADARSERQLSHIQHCQQPNQPKCTPHPPLQGWATLYHCCQNGVDRVFVDHPLFLDTYGNNNANTYLQGGSQIPDLDLQYSILCQAALAAPILLWHQPQDHLHRLQLQALVSKVPQTLCGGVAQYIGLHAASLAQQNSWLMNADKASQPSTAGWRKPTVAGPVMLTGDIACSMSSSQSCPSTSSADSLLKEDQQMTHSELSGIMWPASVGNIAFVGNDWPCFPLSQHLHRLQSPGLESEGRRQALSGALQASTQPACSAANNFETHMARLLKSARVAFCIHNLAYQGIFAQVCFLGPCLLQHTASREAASCPGLMHIQCICMGPRLTCDFERYTVIIAFTRDVHQSLIQVLCCCGRIPLTAFASLLLHCPAYRPSVPTVMENPIWLVSLAAL